MAVTTGPNDKGGGNAPLDKIKAAGLLPLFFGLAWVQDRVDPYTVEGLQPYKYRILITCLLSDIH